MRGTKRLNRPMITIPVRDQCSDADNRMIDVLWEFLSQLGSDFIVALAVVTIRRSIAS